MTGQGTYAVINGKAVHSKIRRKRRTPAQVRAEREKADKAAQKK